MICVCNISCCNNSIAKHFYIKTKSKIQYHTFVEVFDLHPNRAEEVFEKGKLLLQELKLLGLKGSLVPHATYTVSQKLLKKISEFSYEPEAILCIHNQETSSENEMFRGRKGELFQFLNKASLHFNEWKQTGFNALPSTLVHLPNCNKIGLVHNTYTVADDITWAHLYSMQIFWCLCPNANLFIENRLPDIPVFIRNSCRIILGTDSYASNWSLSILDEMKRIHTFFPEINFQTMLAWATIRGAEFLGLHRSIGSFEKGKKPGVNLLEHVEMEKLQLTGETKVVKII